MFKLVIQDDEGKTTVVPLIRDEITIGRKEGNTIRLTERNVSRRHARILRNNGEVHIEDLGSYNGIRVNNARIAERVSLRVSDQVQIGDYKLYLKAEGIEQVDESRTMPHERMDSPVATEAMSSVGPAVTAPQIPAIQPLPPAQMIGNPARTLVAIGDTDPAGRAIGPVTAEAVAAMSAAGASGAYGRLVVLSSNFAGKEFELSRPQMIVGRTDDNDLVVNHRSISRNHAKLVREPDTGRYTISDLQSSNGVRVNGQDYGKVELRRGDVVDLGHVRLRFVEPGEDFVFARDAVITDVPESGGRRGLVFAILAAVVVLGASVAIYATLHNNADKPQGDVVVPTGSGSNSGLTLDGGEAIAINDQRPALGSSQPPIEAPADAVAAVRPDDDKSQKAGRCMELQAAKDWQGLIDCAKALDNLGNKDKAKDFTDMALREQRNELKANAAKQALRDHNLKEAQAQLAEIGESSVYFKSLSEVFNKAEAAAIDAAVRKAQAYATAHDCVGLRTQYKQLAASSTAHVAAAIGPVKCVERGTPPDNPIKSPVAVGSGSATPPPPVAPTPPKGPCDSINVDDTMAQAQNQYGAGYAKAALSLMVKALGCRQDIRMYRIAALYACAAHDVTTAKMYYKKLEPSMQGAIVQRCQQENLDVRLP